MFGMWTHNHDLKDLGLVIDTHEKKSKQWKKLSFVTLALVSEETFAVPFADSFEIHNSRKMKRTFKVSILVLVSHGQSIVYLKSSLESPVQGKWKGLSVVILVLVSQQSWLAVFNDIFWKSKFKENEKDFQLSILGLVSHEMSIVFFMTSLESPVQGKWKGLWCVILPLVSKHECTVPFNDMFWKSKFKENEKDFQLSILALVSHEKSSVSLMTAL